MGGDIGEIQLGSEREPYKYINHYEVVVTKASSKIILVQVYIIFALPDYSSEVSPPAFFFLVFEKGMFALLKTCERSSLSLAGRISVS